MRIKVNLFSTAKHITQAQWRLVDTLNQTLGRWNCGDVGQSLQETLRQAESQAHSPQEWAELFAHALVGMITTLHNEIASASRAADDARRVRKSLQLECDSLRSDVQSKVNWYVDQILTLTSERNQAQAEIDQLTHQVTTLKTALAGAQQAHQDEIKCLQAEITDLRRITAEQQLRLNAHNA